MSQNSAADNLQVFHRNSSSISVPSKWMDGFGSVKVFLNLKLEMLRHILVQLQVA